MLKFIRGSITGKPVFTEAEIKGEFIEAIKQMVRTLKLDVNMSNVKRNLDDIVVTILTLLHDCKIKLYDESISNCYLSVHPSKNSYSLCLMTKFGNMCTPLISTEILIDKYLTNNDIDLAKFSLGPMPMVFLRRNENGKLILIESLL